MSTRVPYKYDYRDLVDIPESFSGTPITDAGTGENRLETEVLFFSDGFTINTESDGSGVLVTEFDFAQKNERMTSQWGMDVYEAVVITDPLYQTGTIYAFGDIAGSVVFADDPNRLQDQIDQINQGTNYDDIGTFKYFATYKDRPSLLPFAYDNAISQSTYQPLFDEVGHQFNEDHVNAGDTDLSGSSTLFYPTPTPDSYPRIAFPDFIVDGGEFVGISIDIGTSNEKNITHSGTPIRFLASSGGSLPAEVTEGVTYYVRDSTPGDGNVSFHPTEAGAVGNFGHITFTAGSGEIILTQEGISIDDAFQGHAWGSSDTRVLGTYQNNSPGGSPSVLSDTVANRDHLNVNSPQDDKTNGTPRTTNETRGKTFFQYGYIKAESITPSGEPVSALREVINFSIPSNAQTVVITHNNTLGVIEELAIEAFYINGGGVRFLLHEDLVDGGQFGWAKNDDGLVDSETQFNFQTGSDGLKHMNSGGGFVTITTGTIELIITKPNLVTTYFESTTKTYDISDGVDVTVIVPDAATNVAERTYIRKGAGTGKLILTSAGGDFDFGDNTETTVEIEAAGQAVISPQGGLQYVKQYDDSGSNSEGTWVKYRNGEMVCKARKAFSGINITAASGGIYYSTSSIVISYAKNMLSVLSGHITAEVVSNSYWTSPSTASVSGISAFLVAGSTVSNVSGNLAMTSTGRWRT